MFGSNFYEKKQDGYLIDKYRYCSLNQDKHIKTICKPQFVKNIKIHGVDLCDGTKYVDPKKNIIKEPFNENYTIDIIQINHYHCKSVEEQFEKHLRGYPDQIGNPFIPYNHDINNEVIDNTIVNKYLHHIDHICRINSCNWEIYKELNPDLQSFLFTETDYYNHIIFNGRNEPRFFHLREKYPSFSREIYKVTNPDLYNLSDLDLELHFLQKGIHEGRIHSI
jgi:hypothetical protein